MNKTSIKIIKRKDAPVAANGETQNLHEPKLTAAFSEEKIERLLHRKLANTVSEWIAERRTNNRAEENASLRRIFGTESLLNKIA